MLRDVFYYGKKPNVHPRERFATSLQDARNQSTTEHFWIINEFCDYKNFDWDFDFDFLPDEDVWAEDHNNVWPSVYQKDSGTWLCSKNDSDIIIYRGDVDPLKRKNEKNSHWEILQPIDESKFDFGWHPDPTSPPYIYVWGNKWIPAELKPTLKYHVEGATQEKYMSDVVAVVPEKERWVFLEDIEEGSFDFTWRPDPREPNLIWVFGNKQHSGRVMPTIEYHLPGAGERKFIETHGMQPKLAAKSELFQHLEDSHGIDYSWRPDPTSPPYIYAWGNQWNKPEDKISIQYVVEGATEYKYMEERAIRKPCMDNWEIPANVDVSDFDFSWEPNPHDPAYIYEFGTQWQKTGGPRYVVDGATEIKYIDIQKAKALPSRGNWTVPVNCDVTGFDFSWHPDSTSPAYIYNFATQWAMTGGPTYTVPGATEVTYVEFPMAIALPDRTNWVVPNDVDAASFDFSWHPYVEDQPYIYQFGTQHQKTGGPKYVTPGATSASPVKYIDVRILKAIRLPNKKRFAILDNLKIKDFDFSWHPDETEEPYIYVFGNNQYPAEIMPTIEYAVSGATQIKYVNDIVATLDVDMSNWEIPENIDTTGFDFSWKPNPKDPAYIYEFGTQWQKTGGPRYVVDGATETKYVTTHQVKALPTTENWTVPKNCDVSGFDFSWHPDNTSPAYIYNFATQWAMTGGPIYTVPGATETTYVEYPMAIALPDRTNWVVPNDVDAESFDFSWHPYVEDQPYVYQFGTQWQKTGGPKYVTPGATTASPVKYIDSRILKATRLPNKQRFAILDNLKIKDFDFSWHPDETEEPYIYVFGNNQYPAEIMPTIEYRVPGATQVKYINDVVATLDTDMLNWHIPDDVDTTDFDFTWKPNPKDPTFIYEWGTQWQKTGGPRYVPADADENTPVKYMDNCRVKRLANRNNWVIPRDIDVKSFDFSWHPDATEKPYIYQFGTQWALTGGPKYIAPEATEVKYMDEPVAKAAPSMKYWVVPNDIDTASFDFSWHPYAEDQPYVYQFGTQWQKTGGPKYIGPDADETSFVKYIDTRVLKAKKLPNRDHWHVPANVDPESIDYSWHPDETEQPYIYHFGTQWNERGGPEYRVPGATQYKYMTDIVGNTKRNKANWYPLIPIDESKFDYSWVPHPDSPPYIYVFGNQWFSAEKEPTIEYRVPGATQKKYINAITAYALPDMTKWEIKEGIDVSTFDFSWRPDPGSPPYIYQFGTIANDEDGPRYIHPDNNGEVVKLVRVEKEKTEDEFKVIPKYFVETTLEDLVKQHPNEIFWALNPKLDYSDFNFDWRPSIEQARYVHAFGSSASELTQTYFVNAYMWEQGHRDINWVEDKALDDETLFKLFKKPDMFFVDRGNVQSNDRYQALKAKFPSIQKTRFLNTWVDTINRCINRADSNLCWILDSNLDYSNFDFNYYPNPWQMQLVHVFGTQWSHWGTTFMVNRETFANDTKYIKIIEHLSNLNFVKNRIAIATNCLYDIVLVDHGNKETETVLELLKKKVLYKDISVVKFDDSYLKTFQNFIHRVPDRKENYLWICSSVCDYTEFQFNYVPDPFAKDQLHVFPSDRQKFGDTFLVDVTKTKTLIDDLTLLDEYKKVNYNQHQRVRRLPAPVIVTGDTHVDIVNKEFDFPYAVLVTEDNQNIKVNNDEPMALWAPNKRNIIISSSGGTSITVPRDVKDYIKKELYDYPYIKPVSRLQSSNPMDIVFLSNGEKCADENYEHLLDTVKGLPNRVVRVDGINGRVQAYHAAVNASNTPWAFTVFAKLKVSNKFDWGWQPDRLQVPKHYIFHAKNPVNDLVYGHQAMIAYNKKLVLANDGSKGLDFTLDDEHEVIEILSGVAMFNTDEFSTWRTAFREVLKLHADSSEVSKQRLRDWLTKAKGDFAEYSINGAKDAIEYFESVKGDMAKLKLSYEWSWLQDYFNKKYK